ncbi:hypothetical protein V8E36_004019 [Tilletia maclaganii]
MDLFDDGIDVGSGSLDLKVNEQYAARFTHNRRRAELDQLKEKYGDQEAAAAAAAGSDTTDSEEDETEDEDGEQVTAEVDAALLRTLAKIKKRDASIYDSSKRVFDAEHEHILSKVPRGATAPQSKGNEKHEKMTLQDYQRQRVEELIKTSADPARALAEATTAPARQTYIDDDEPHNQHPTHAQEQEALRRQVTAAFHAEDGEDEDDFFKPRNPAGGAQGNDNEDSASGAYRSYLLSAIEGDDLDSAVRDALKDKSAYQAIVAQEEDANGVVKQEETPDGDAFRGKKGTKRKRKTKQQEDDDFLMNYVLNRGWIDEPAASARPKSSKKRKADASDDDTEEQQGQAQTSNLAYGRDWEAEAAELESEASFDSRAEAFENAYNFRFEAIADGSAPAAVQSFARASQLKDSVRREDDTRKKKREERRERKEKEKAERMAELERFRDLQREDIRDRVRRIIKEAGAEEEAQFAHLDLDGDFDPDAHDKAMLAAFDSGYYAHGGHAEGEDDDDDFGGDDDEGKPTWDDDIDIDDILAAEGDYVAQQDGGDKKGKKKEKKKLKKQQKALERKQAEEGGGARNDAGDDDAMEVDRFASGSNVKMEDLDDDALRGLSKEERAEKVKDMVEKYHELDYEDMIGDMPTRFKYASVPKVDYGLSPVEILMADDRDLNEVVGLKMLQPYRKGKAQTKRPPDLNRRLREFRAKLAKKEAKAAGRGGSGGSASAPSATGANAEKVKSAKRKGKKERLKLKAQQSGTAEATEA